MVGVLPEGRKLRTGLTARDDLPSRWLVCGQRASESEGGEGGTPQVEALGAPPSA